MESGISSPEQSNDEDADVSQDTHTTVKEQSPSRESSPDEDQIVDEDSNDLSSQKDDDDLSLDGSDEAEGDYYEIKNHPSYVQVMLDVNRCAGRLEYIRQCYHHRTDDDNEPPEDLTEELELQKSNPEAAYLEEPGKTTSKISEPIENEKAQRIAKDLQCQKKLKQKLAKLIVRLLMRKQSLHYYQGFHDVCLTYMTIYGDSKALDRLDHVIDSHFSIFMQPTMLETQEFLALIPIIIGLQDKTVADFLERAEVGTIFALSWVITWFSHVIPNERDVETIFSHLEQTSDPHLILYLSAEIVLQKREQLMQLEPEMSTIHHFLCQLPRKEKLPIEDLLRRADAAFQKWSPEVVRGKLSQYRREKLQLQGNNLIRTLTQQFMPALASFVTSPNSRRAIVVFVVASALALQFDRWIR